MARTFFKGESSLREREYWERRAATVGEAAGQSLSLSEYMNLLYSPPSDSLIRWACIDVVERALAASISVSVLTNDLRTFHGPEWERDIALLQRVNHLIDCSETGILKPDPRAFERALEITGFTAEKVLFVDDQPLSVTAAEALGIDALWFDIAHPDESWAAVAELIEV